MFAVQPLPSRMSAGRLTLSPALSPALIGAGIALAGLFATDLAFADRCKPNASGTWICTYQERTHAFATPGIFGCNGAKGARSVRWQVPEGTPPEGGWPVAFFYQGTVPASDASKAFTITSTLFGAKYLQASLHELLDDPQGSGRKYAVVSADASTRLLGLQYWDTNQLGSYAQKDDACFLPDLFKGIASGAYGSPSQFNMNRRFAFGISSGGYNTSRMAVSFNDASNWRALAVVSASYATCAGPLCSIPRTLPANHPPTKFYHGTADHTVGISTMRPYFDKLRSQGIEVEKVEHDGGHEFTADAIGSTGIKAWFDRF